MNKKQFLVALLMLAVSGLVGGFVSDWLRGGSAEATGAAPTIKAGEILLVDKAGKTRGGLQMAGGEPRIFLNNDQGKPSASLSLKGNLPEFVFYDANQTKQFSLNVNSETGPLLKMMDTRGKVGFRMEFKKKWGPMLSLMHKSGDKRALYLSVNQPLNAPSIGLSETGGTPNIRLSVENKFPWLLIQDDKGERQVSLEVSEELGPVSSLVDGIARYWVVNQIHPKSGPFYKMADPDHERVLYLKMNRERAIMGVSAKPPHNKMGFFAGLVGDKPFISLEDPTKSEIYAGMRENGKPVIEISKQGKKFLSLPK